MPTSPSNVGLGNYPARVQHCLRGRHWSRSGGQRSGCPLSFGMIKLFSSLSRQCTLMLRCNTILQNAAPKANMETGSDIDSAMRVTLTGTIPGLH